MWTFKCALFSILRNLDISGKCSWGDLGSTSVSRIECGNIIAKLWIPYYLPKYMSKTAEMWLKVLICQTWSGRNRVYLVFELSTQKWESRKVPVCFEAPYKCDFRCNTLGCGHKWRWAQILTFGQKAAASGSNCLMSIWGFLRSVYGQLCTKVSLLSFRHLWQYGTAENVFHEPHNHRIHNLWNRVPCRPLIMLAPRLICWNDAEGGKWAELYPLLLAIKSIGNEIKDDIEWRGNPTSIYPLFLF